MHDWFWRISIKGIFCCFPFLCTPSSLSLIYYYHLFTKIIFNKSIVWKKTRRSYCFTNGWNRYHSSYFVGFSRLLHLKGGSWERENFKTFTYVIKKKTWNLSAKHYYWSCYINTDIIYILINNYMGNINIKNVKVI